MNSWFMSNTYWILLSYLYFLLNLCSSSVVIFCLFVCFPETFSQNTYVFGKNRCNPSWGNDQERWKLLIVPGSTCLPVSPMQFSLSRKWRRQWGRSRGTLFPLQQIKRRSLVQCFEGQEPQRGLATQDLMKGKSEMQNGFVILYFSRLLQICKPNISILRNVLSMELPLLFYACLLLRYIFLVFKNA